MPRRALATAATSGPSVYSLLLIGIVLLAVYYCIQLQLLQKQGVMTAAAVATVRPPPSEPVSVQIAVAQQGGDDRYTRAPKPERHWVTRPETPTAEEMYGKLPRIPTRGLPETYQSMGVLTMEDGAILPLYGRRTASRSDRFQYYTRTDTYNPVQLPLNYKRRSCVDDIGCDELFDGETVSIGPTNQKGKATIYRFDGPTYVPGIV